MSVSQTQAVPANDALSFESTIEEFCEYLLIQKRYSAHTISSYRRDLREVAKSLQGIDVEDWSATNPFNMLSLIHISEPTRPY